MNGATEHHHPAELALYHQNPRVGDVDAIVHSLRAHGQYKPVVVNRGTHTGRPLEVLAGNHTVKAFRDLTESEPEDDRWQEVHCWVVDVDDDRAARIVAVDNRTSDLGSFDDQVLSDLLSSLPDLEGTGYSDDDLEMLNDILNESPDLDELGDETEAGDPDTDHHQSDVGEHIARADALWGEPDHTVESGDIYTLHSTSDVGEHVLVIAKLSTEHEQWAEFLAGRQFHPYPDPYLTLSELGETQRLLMVQPNKYLAGHLLDKHASVHGETSIERAETQ